MSLPDSSNSIIKPFDLTRQICIYDGNPEDWNVSVEVALGWSNWSFSLAEIDRQNFSQLEQILGAENFKTIVETQEYANSSNDSKAYWGKNGLPLRYYFRASQYPGIDELIIISFGEFQSSRWIAYIEGIWHVTGATMNGNYENL